MKRLGDTIDFAVLEGILATVLDGVIVADPKGQILDCSELASSIFGYQRDELIGQEMDAMIIPENQRKAHREGMRRVRTGGQSRILGTRLELEGLHRSGKLVPIELAITRAGSIPNEIYVAFLRDISERRRYESALSRRAFEAELVADISSLAASAENFDDALKATLEAILKLTGWPVGHAFVQPVSGNLLQSAHVWVGDGRDLTGIKQRTEDTVWLPGAGLPGAIFNSAKPEWIEDLSGPDFPRSGLGFRSAFGFPILSEGHTIAVLEFFLEQPAEKDPEMLRVLGVLGNQLGRVFERKLTDERQKLLVNEINHRVKNTITVIQSVAQQTFVADVDLAEAQAMFSKRLHSIALAQDALTAKAWAKASFRQILDDAIAGSGVDAGRFKVSGPDFDVKPQVAVSISLAIHELTTNALKYGALSLPSGLVEICWGIEKGSDPIFFFKWTEVGGPRVTKPTRRGFGSKLLSRGLTLYAGGTVRIEYPPEGLTFCFESPLRGRN